MEGEQLMSDLSYMQHLYQDEHEDAKSPAEDMLLYEDTRQPFVKETKVIKITLNIWLVHNSIAILFRVLVFW